MTMCPQPSGVDAGPRGGGGVDGAPLVVPAGKLHDAQNPPVRVSQPWMFSLSPLDSSLQSYV